MKLLTDLFSTDYGLMSLAVILFVLLMGQERALWECSNGSLIFIRINKAVPCIH